MLDISVLISIVCAFYIFLFLEKSNTPVFKFKISNIILILLFLTLVTDRYNHESNFYKGASSCKENIVSSVSKNSSVGNSINNNTNNFKYRVMSPVARHEQYNFYVIRKIKIDNNELNSEVENNLCNQILKTNSNVIYYLGDTVSVVGVSSEGQSIVTFNGQNFNYDEYIFYKYNADQIFEIFKNKNYLNDYIPPHTQVLSYADHLSVWRRERADLFDMYHHTDVAELLAGMTLGTDITMSIDLKSDLQR